MLEKEAGVSGAQETGDWRPEAGVPAARETGDWRPETGVPSAREAGDGGACGARDRMTGVPAARETRGRLWMFVSNVII